MQCSNGNAKQSSRTGNLFLVSLHFIIVFVFFFFGFHSSFTQFCFLIFRRSGLLASGVQQFVAVAFFSIPLNLLFYHFFRCTSVFRTWAAGSLYFGILLFIMTTSLCFSPLSEFLCFNMICLSVSLPHYRSKSRVSLCITRCVVIVLLRMVMLHSFITFIFAFIANAALKSFICFTSHRLNCIALNIIWHHHLKCDAYNSIWITQWTIFQRYTQLHT